MSRYIAVIDSVMEAAREAWQLGMNAEEAGRLYQVPEQLGEWVLFNPAYYQWAIEAWLRELGA